MAESSKEGSGRKNVHLHPLAIVAISDHFTGIQAGSSIKPPGSKVLGILWGKQQGLEVVITDAVELLYQEGEGGVPAINPAEVNKQKDLYTKVYKDHEMLGWYSVGTDVTPVDTEIHKEMTKYNESPFFLLIHPSPEPDAKDLPLNMYESELHSVGTDEMRMIFVDVEFNLDSTQAERVTMEAVAEAAPLDGVSTLDLHVASLQSSLNSLRLRADTIVGYLEAVESGALGPDQKVLRSIAGIVQSLPVVDKADLEKTFFEDYADSMMVKYLATVTKSTSRLNEVSEKFQKIDPSRSHRL